WNVRLDEVFSLLYLVKVGLRSYSLSRVPYVARAPVPIVLDIGRCRAKVTRNRHSGLMRWVDPDPARRLGAGVVNVNTAGVQHLHAQLGRLALQIAISIGRFRARSAPDRVGSIRAIGPEDVHDFWVASRPTVGPEA